MTQNTFYGYPDPLAPKSEKDSNKYGLEYFRAMYQEWSGIDESIITNRNARWHKSRLYADGRQSVQKYKDRFDMNGEESYINLDWSVVPIIPKFINVVVGNITNPEYNIQATAIDPRATDLRLQKELDLKANVFLKDFYDQLTVKTGVNFMNQDAETPKTPEEIELFMQLHYKQATEIALEEGIELCMTVNRWNEIKKRVVRDLVTLGIAATKTRCDQHGVHTRYVDPMKLVTTYSERPDYSDITHAGEVIKMKISDLKKYAGDQISEEGYRSIAKTFMGRFGNPKSHSYNWSYNEEEYQNFTVEVLDAQFIVPIELNYEKKFNRYGNYTVSRKQEGYKPPKSSKFTREQINTSYDCKYEGMWVIGTDYIFNYGKAANQKRSETNLSKVELDYTIYAPDLYDMENKSIVERIIGFADEIQVISLKIQQLIMKMRPKGAAIEVGSLEGVDNGKGGTFTPLDLAEIYDQTGNYYYRSLDEEGQPSGARPITELDGGVGSALGELLNMYNHYVNQIRDATGINEAMDATTPNSKALVGVQKLSIMAANNAIRFINDAYLDVYERTAIAVAKAIQAVVKYDKPLKGFIKAIGQSNMKVIEVGSEVGLHEFGLKIESLPDEVEKQQLNADVQISLDRQEIQVEDAIMIRKIPNVKLAVQMLILKRKKYAEQRQAEAQQNSKAQAEEQIRVAQEKAQMDAQRLQVEADQKIRVLEAEYNFKVMLAREIEGGGTGSPDRLGRSNPNDLRL